MRLLALLLFVVSNSANAKVLFEGYYRIEAKGKHAGYSVLRHTVDETRKEDTIAYFVHRGDSEKFRRYAVKAVARSNGFGPVKYEMFEWPIKGTPLHSLGMVKGKQLDLVVTDLVKLKGGKKKKEIARFKFDVAPGAFLSSFLAPILAAQQPGAKPGDRFSFRGFSEEDRIWAPGEVLVLKTGTLPDAGKITQALTSYVSDRTEMFYTSDGQVLGYRNLAADTVLFVTARREQAVGELPFAKEPIQTVFGDIPHGLTNAVSRANGKWPMTDVMRAFTTPPKQMLDTLGKPGAKALQSK